MIVLLRQTSALSADLNLLPPGALGPKITRNGGKKGGGSVSGSAKVGAADGRSRMKLVFKIALGAFLFVCDCFWPFYLTYHIPIE